MGLRLKIIVSLLAILAGMAGLSVGIVREQLLSASLVQERADAENDMRRLLLALDAQLAQLDVVLGSWSNYTAMYEHMARPDPQLMRDELTAASLRAASIDWLYLVDRQDRVREHAEVPWSDGVMPMREHAQDEVPRLMQSVASLARSRVQGCGVILLEQRFAMLCFRPLLRSDRTGESRGTVLIGRWLAERTLEAVERQTKLDFRLIPLAPTPVTDGSPAQIEAAFASGTPVLQLDGQHLDVEMPVISLDSQRIGTLRMEWERNAFHRLQDSQRYITSVLVLLILFTGVAMLAVVDRMVVRRLGRLESELRAVVGNQHWAGELGVTGQDEIGRLAQYVNGVIEVVRRQLIELTSQSNTDVLTGLPNRRQFEERLRVALARQHRHGRVCALLLLDVDFFKRYNDAYGHPAGDRALQEVADCLRSVARRPDDLPARLGGEEFALLLEDAELPAALERAEAVRACLQAKALAHKASGVAEVLTLSVGVSLALPDDTPESLYSRTDQALYRAKGEGRNRVASG